MATRSSSEVYFNYQQTMEAVRELRSIARETRHAADVELGGTLRRASANWQGDNAEAFATKCSTLQGKVSSTAEDIEHIANAVERMAKNTYQAEMNAIRIAQNK